MGLRRRPRPLAEALARFQSKVAPPTLLGEVQRAWTDAVGDDIAAHAQPVSERDGIVTARCDSAVWAAELTMLARSLSEALNANLGAGRRVRGIKFTAGPQ